MIPFLDLKSQYLSIKDEIQQVLSNVLDSTEFTLGRYVKQFEENFSRVHHTKHCAGVNNGTSALHVVLMALGIRPGDEVIVPTNTFFATPEAVSLAGATPVFADCLPDYTIDPSHVERLITDKTRAILPVHLYGHPADLDSLNSIAQGHNLYLIEDCAQSHLARYKGHMTGSIGIAGCFSFYPGKNLGAYGEAGAVITNDKDLFEKICMIRDHGSSKKYYHDVVGHNYRMEGFQGAILDVKLKYLPAWTEARREKAIEYRKRFDGLECIALPPEHENMYHVYHLFPIRTAWRDELAIYLKDNGVSTGIHYPIPCHLQKAYAYLGYGLGSLPRAEKFATELLSLPMYPELEIESICAVVELVKRFASQKSKGIA